MTVEYEWAIETLEGPDTDEVEILDVQHASVYADALKMTEGLQFCRIALVRNQYDAGYSTRSWAYVQGDMLPSHCEDAFGHEVAQVPKRYRAQFKSAGQ